MNGFPPSEPPAFWVTVSVFVAALALIVIMLVYTSTRVEAQEQPLCAPAEILLRQFSEIHKERPVWRGTVPQDTGPIEVILLQGAKNTWTLFTVRGGIACILASGRDATPIETDRGV